MYIDISDLATSSVYRHLSSIFGLQIDLRYATANNFMGRDLYGPYDCGWLHVDACARLERTVAWLNQYSERTSLVVLDAVRPRRVQQLLWDAVKGTALSQYVADPSYGSIHEFGMAVDVSLLDASGVEVDMGTGFDDMTERSHPAKEQQMLASGELTQVQVNNRLKLRAAMQAGGFAGISTEWWHFDLGDRKLVRATYPRVV
jgi:zinc D-Ala-D-Ala dipeptidase